MTVRTAIDVEALVEWAYRRQKVGARPGRDVIGSADIPSSWRLVATVGEYGCALGLGGSGGGGAWGGVSEPGMPDDALAVALEVELCGADAAALMAKHGRTGTRPDWRPGARARCLPAFDDRGRVIELWDWDDNRHKINQHCPMVHVDRPESVAHARELYVLWRTGLDLIAQAFRADPELLLLWTVTGPAAPARPWAAPADRLGAGGRACPVREETLSAAD